MRSQKGQSLVEMAISITLLIVLVMGIIDFGRVFFTHLTLHHAGREAARAASLGATNIQIENVAKDAAGSLDPSKLGFAIDPSDQSMRTRGTYTTISLTYSVDIITPLMQQFLPNPYNVKTETVMRVE